MKLHSHGVKCGVNVIGYFQRSLGLGESGRLITNALQEQSIPFSLLSADFLVVGQDQQDFAKPISNDFVHPINLFCLDSTHISDFIEKSHWDQLKDRYNIGLWFWETNKIPDFYKKSWKYLDEIWVTTRYVQEHLSIASTVPVHRIPQPVSLSHPPAGSNKKKFGLENKYTFLFCFNFLSIVDRKNPMAIIQAFQQAFPFNHDVQLVIKSQHAGLFPHQFQPLQERIKKDARIVWMDQSMNSQERFELMNACDCYISLHRSEGFGLTMAEAMLLEKPVIATGYSGNLDFMHEENSFLCPYTFVSVGPMHHPYPEEGIWAEVDIDQAAYWMEYVVKHPEAAKAKAIKGKYSILQHHSCQVVGEQIAKRLQQIKLPSTSRKKPWQFKKAKLKQAAKRRLAFLLPVLRPIKRTIKRVLKRKQT